MTNKIRTYSELIRLNSFEERFEYLKLSGEIGIQTFGFDRYLNQSLYRSPEWKKVRREIIIRDNGCDLGIDGYDIIGKIIIHHMNPLSVEAIRDRKPYIMDPEYLISVSLNTHNAIHYSDDSILPKLPKERRPGDTKLW